jgi:predicted small secreted protein
MCMFKLILSIALFIAVALCFTGCQTFGGFGGDLKWTGEQIEAGAANCTVPPLDSNK